MTLASFINANVKAEALEKSNFYILGSYGVGIANKFDYEEILKIQRPEDIQLKIQRPTDIQIFGLAFGYKFNPNVRSEIAFYHSRSFHYHNPAKQQEPKNVDHLADQKSRVNALFLNFYLESNEIENFTPYIGLGIGVSRNKAGTLYDIMKQQNKPDIRAVANEGDTKNNFAFNLGGGLTYKLSPKLDWELISYKYYDLGLLSTKADSVGDKMKTGLRVHTLSTGIKIKF